MNRQTLATTFHEQLDNRLKITTSLPQVKHFFQKRIAKCLNECKLHALNNGKDNLMKNAFLKRSKFLPNNSNPTPSINQTQTETEYEFGWGSDFEDDDDDDDEDDEVDFIEDDEPEVKKNNVQISTPNSVDKKPFAQINPHHHRLDMNRNNLLNSNQRKSSNRREPPKRPLSEPPPPPLPKCPPPSDLDFPDQNFMIPFHNLSSQSSTTTTSSSSPVYELGQKSRSRTDSNETDVGYLMPNSVESFSNNRLEWKSSSLSVLDRPLPAIPKQDAAEIEPEILTNLKQYSWFQDIERDQAEAVLKKISTDGAFLVRKSRRAGACNPFTLTLVFNDRVFHLNIRKRQDRRFALGTEKPKEKTFHSIPDLIEYYRQEPIYLTSKGLIAGKTTLISMS